MPKRKCNFTNNYTKEWLFIKRGRNLYVAHCTIYNIFISVSHSGKTSIHDHNNSNTHKSNTSIASYSRDTSTFIVKENTPEDILVCAAELTTAYKVVNHHQ
jgi:thioredoxin-related protein